MALIGVRPRGETAESIMNYKITNMAVYDLKPFKQLEHNLTMERK